MARVQSRGEGERAGLSGGVLKHRFGQTGVRSGGAPCGVTGSASVSLDPAAKGLGGEGVPCSGQFSQTNKGGSTARPLCVRRVSSARAWWNCRRGGRLAQQVRPVSRAEQLAPPLRRVETIAMRERRPTSTRSSPQAEAAPCSQAACRRPRRKGARAKKKTSSADGMRDSPGDRNRNMRGARQKCVLRGNWVDSKPEPGAHGGAQRPPDARGSGLQREDPLTAGSLEVYCV